MGGRADRGTHLRVVTMGTEAKEAAERLRESDVLRDHLPEDSIDEMARELGTRKVLHVDADTGEVLTPGGESTGRTLEDLAEEVDFDLRLVGNDPQLNLEGVMPPELDVLHSTIKLKTGTYTVKGQFRAGDVVDIVLRVKVERVSFGLLRETGNRRVYGVERQHEVEMPDFVRRAPDVDAQVNGRAAHSG